MRETSYRACLVFVLLSLSYSSAQERATLRIIGNGVKTTEITSADLATMPRLSVDVQNSHTGNMENYEGVRLSEVLAKAGVAFGEKLRGRALATYVRADASDGYAVVYSIAEIDPGLTDNRIIVADTMNGRLLAIKEGPFKIVVPSDNVQRGGYGC